MIVESGAKARTIERYLGAGYNVEASVGHVRDLPDRSLGVDVENDFAPRYVVSADRRQVVSRLKSAAAGAEVYLATDPDREGEAIAWHLSQLLGIPASSARRVVFHEITEDAIKRAFADPRPIDYQLVDAQQARRILDRLVGFKLSPFVRNKVAGGQSAGRVQSVALRLVVDREREIEQFGPVEYWQIFAQLGKSGHEPPIVAELVKIPGRKGSPGAPRNDRPPLIPDGELASRLVADLDASNYRISDVKTQERKDRPSPPFITSTLQQQAARALRFGSDRTMRVAQSLYEGVDIGGERAGLITYMRTDSTTIADAALREAASYIQGRFGERYTSGPRRYRTRSRNAQEAHEAIRPTSISRTPSSLRGELNDDQWRLYNLIWNRTVASQMADALLERTTAEVDATATSGVVYGLRATGTRVLFDGYRALYSEARDEDAESEDSRILPPLAPDEVLSKREVTSEQKFTTPPPRFTEANLIRELERLGIGRPSTYASIVSTIVNRNYVERERNRFRPTKVGVAVCDMLKAWFTDIMDVGFTAGMESKLDDIAEGELEWVPMLREFYAGFDDALEHAFQNAERTGRAHFDEPSGLECEGGQQLVIRETRHGGSFIACPRFPECKFAMDVKPSEGSSGELLEEWQGEFERKMLTCHIAHPDGPPPGVDPDVNYAGVQCASGTELVVKSGRRGKFLGCSKYPDCRFTVNAKPLSGAPAEELEKWQSEFETRMVNCVGSYPDGAPRSAAQNGVPAGFKCEGGANLVIKGSRRGNFVACPEYPQCRVALDLKPESGSELAAWESAFAEKMSQCFKAHPEAAKKAAAPRRRRTSRRAGARAARG